MNRNFLRYFHFFSILFIVCFLCTCGLEDYPFIFPVPQSYITMEMNSRATVRIPTNNSGSSFTHFAIFYRIYVSDEMQPNTVSTNTDSNNVYTVINPALATDINYVRPYIDSDTYVNVNMESFFQGRNFKYLYFQNGSIDDVLSDSPPSVLGSALEFDFSSNKNPTMVKKDSAGNVIQGPFTLWRSNGYGQFTPQPDRLFNNTEDLWNSENINANTNADVVNKSNFVNSSRYTYAAMYIVAVGKDTSSSADIYSTPSLIHVFLLPGI